MSAFVAEQAGEQGVIGVVAQNGRRLEHAASARGQPLEAEPR